MLYLSYILNQDFGRNQRPENNFTFFRSLFFRFILKGLIVKYHNSERAYFFTSHKQEKRQFLLKNTNKK